MGQAGYIQSAANTVSSTSATSASVTINPSIAGDFLAVFIGLDGANALTVTVSSVTDGTNTYSKVVSKTQSGTINEDSEIWAASNVSSGITSITVNISGALGTSGQIQVIVAEYVGVDTGSVATITCGTGTGSNAGSATASASITPTANALVVAFVNCSPVNTVNSGFRFRAFSPTAASGNTTNGGATNTVTATGNALQDKLAGIANTAYTPTFNLASSDNWAVVAAAFKVTTGITTGIANIQAFGIGGSPMTPMDMSNCEAGNTLVGCVSIANATGTLTSVKDTTNNMTFTVSANSPAVDASAGSTVYLTYLQNITAGTRTVSATTSGGTSSDVFWVYELFGVQASSFDIDAKATAHSGTTIAAPSITTSATDVLISVGQGANTITGTSNSWIESGIFHGELSIFKGAQPPSTYNANYTQNTAGTWAVVLAGFKASVAFQPDEDFWSPPATKAYDPVVTVF